jgi:hypothetical protein
MSFTILFIVSSFISLHPSSASLRASHTTVRTTAFLTRLYTSPLPSNLDNLHNHLELLHLFLARLPPHSTAAPYTSTMSPVAVSAASVPAHSSDKALCEPKKQASPGFEMCAGGIECAPGEVHPWHKLAMPTQEQFKSSPTYPVIVTPNPMANKQVGVCSYCSGIGICYWLYAGTQQQLSSRPCSSCRPALLSK